LAVAEYRPLGRLFGTKEEDMRVPNRKLCNEINVTLVNNY
jgi:hypothetical protein